MEFIQSPNFDGASYRKPIDRIVIHWFGMGTIDNAIAQFLKPNSTSAHYLISGERLVQMVKEENVAWHAGYYPMNQRSIGIEHDANPSKALSEDSYKTSAKLIAEISKRHSIPLDREHVIKHSEIVATQCCGTVDINKLITMAKAILGGDDECTQKVKDLEKELDDMRDSRNTHKADSKAKDGIIAGLNTEIANRIEQVRRKDELIAQKDETIKQLTDESSTATQALMEANKALETKLDTVSKEKGKLELKVTDLQTQIDNLNTMPVEITPQKALEVLIAYVLGRK